MSFRHFCLWPLLTVTAMVWAQEVPDTTDMFYGHVALEEATVTGITGRTRLKDSPTPVTLVSHAELRHASATNIVEAIAHQPGMAQLTTGTGIAKPIIRGLGFNRIVCLSDGVRQEGQQWGDEHGLELDASSVHDVEILKGPASLIYGSDAMAGVVIFRPAPPRAEGTMGGEVSTSFQTNSGLADYTLNFAGNQRGWIWDTRWSQKWAHAYHNKTDGYVPGSAFREQAFKTLMGLSRDWGHLHLTLGYYHLTPGIVEGERNEETGELEAPDGWSGRSYAIALPYQQIYHYKAVLDGQVRLGNGTLVAIAGYQQNQRKEFEEAADDYGLYFKQHTLTYDVRYRLLTPSAWRVQAGIGGMGQTSGNEGSEYLIPAYTLFDIGAFVTAEKRMGSVNLSGGLRYDRRRLHSRALWDDDALRFTDFRRHFGDFSGSIGLTWAATRRLNLKLNLARGFRAPNLAELASNGVHEGTMRYEVGHAALKAEQSWQADLGADYQDRYLSLQAALFLNRIDHYIFTHRTDTRPDGMGVYSYASGDARLWGFEIGADLHPIHSLHLLNTFSYVNAVQLHQPADTKYLPLTPAPHWACELKWEIAHGRAEEGAPRLTLRNPYLAASTDCYLRQGHYYAADGTETATPSYTLLSLSAGTDLCYKGRKVAELYLCADNLTDRAYQSHLSRLKYLPVNNLTGRMGVCNPGRNVTLRLSVPF